jgi:hypothetical protein
MARPCGPHPEPEDCPEQGKLLRHCAACTKSINTISDSHVKVVPTWKRCSHVLCSSCWAHILRSAELVIKADQRGARVWVEEPLNL